MTDPRTVFAMGHIASADLQGAVTAQRFVTPTPMQIGMPVVDIVRSSPTALERQFLLGDWVDVLAPADPSPLCRSCDSGYVGMTGPYAFTDRVDPTHIVTHPATFMFSDSSFKARSPIWVSMGSKLTITGETERFFKTNTGAYVPKAHVTPVDVPNSDPLAMIGQLVGVPYLWGGNSAAGIDCSGLVQMLMRLMGQPCPGDSDQQATWLGDAIAADAPVKPGDLWFWKGHVAISWDGTTLIHANAHHMCVSLEPMDTAIDRIAAQGDGPVTARRRVF